MDAGAALKLGATSAPDDSAPEQVEMPLPSDLRTAFEGGLFLLALLAALYATREIVLPVVLAFVLRLVLQPAVRLLERLRVPGVLSALLLIAILLGAVVTLGTALYGPAASWAAKLPEGIPRLQEHLRFLRAPIEAVHNFLQLAEGSPLAQARSQRPTVVCGSPCSQDRAPLSPAFSRWFWCYFFSLLRATRSCAAWWRFCRASATSVRQLKCCSISNRTSPPISLQ